MNAIRKRPHLFLGLFVTVLFLGFHYAGFGFLDSVDKKAYDVMMHLRAGGDVTEDIVLVAVDDDSIEKLGRWPWPRSILARGLDKISEGKPKVIGLSVILSEPEVSDGLKEIEGLKSLYEKRLAETAQAGAQGLTQAVADPILAAMDEARTRLDNDATLAAALARAKNVVLPVFFTPREVAGKAQEEPDPLLAPHALGAWEGDPGARYPMAARITRPIDSFLSRAADVGHINLLFDPEDSTYRREWLYYEYEGLFIPSYEVALAVEYLDQEQDQTGVRPGVGVSVGPLAIPTDLDGACLVNFRGGDGTFKTYSFFDVINDKIPANLFDGKVVIVTPTAKGIQNPLSTPMGTMNVGEFSANALSTFLSQSFIVEPASFPFFRFLAILLTGILIALVLPRIRAASAAGVFAGLVVVLSAASAWAFSARGLWISPTYPLVMLVVGYIGMVSIQYLLTETTRDKAVGESAETNRMLGVSFQSQGMLDMAFEKFRRVPVDDGMKDLLYSLGLDYERKRQFNKAAHVYEYIEKTDPKFKDVTDRKKKLIQASDTMVFGQGFLGGGTSAGDGLMSTGTDTKPTLGRYEVLRQLGKGAMGVVYLGQDPRINRTTAIKTVRFSEEFEEDVAAEMKQKFFREAESAGTLSHPNIVTIYDAGEEQDLAYIAMEFLEGDDLDKYVKPENLLPMRKVIDYVGDLAEALDYAHAKGIVHRDIKPANVMLLKTGVIKLTDFGIARISSSSKTATGVVKGTPYYMSPEQIAGEKVDGRSDIFSLGVMLYQLLTGKLPFFGESVASLMHQIMNVRHPDPRKYNPKIFKPLVAILDKALEKDREKRYQTAGQMAAHLRSLGKHVDAAMAQKKSEG